MGQNEIIYFLEQERKLNNKWFTAKEINNGLIANNLIDKDSKNIYSQLFILTEFDMIQCRGLGLWKHYKIFRAYKNR